MTSPESDRFHIEKTQAALFEVCKRLTNSTGLSIFFLIIAAMITFGQLVGTSDGGQKKNITLPFMGLTMHWHYVAEIFVVLTCASIFRTFSLNKYERLLQFQLEKLLEKSKWDSVSWALEYPSVFYFFHRIRKLTNIGSSRVKLLGVLHAGPVLAADGSIEVVPVPTANTIQTRTNIPINLGYVIKAEKLIEFDAIFEKMAKTFKIDKE